MQYEKAVIPLAKDFSFDLFETCGSLEADPVLNFHDCFELNFVVEGTGLNIIENKKFELVPGDFYIINSLEHHMAVSNGSLRLKVIIFDPIFIWQNNEFDYEYLKPFFNRSVNFSNCIKGDNPISEQLLSIFKEIEFEWYKKNEGYRLMIKALLMKLLALLYRHFKQDEELGDGIKAFHKSYDRLRDVLRYIHNNIQREMTLDELAKIALMNRTYFSTYFKKVMQVNVSEYIKDMRLNLAANLLRTTNRSIIDVSTSCGFNNVSHFNKMFRRYYHTTPNEFRFS